MVTQEFRIWLRSSHSRRNRYFALENTACPRNFSVTRTGLRRYSDNNSDGFFEYERLALEQLIASNFERAAVVEAWGEVYLRGHRGIHQVHSRRASSVIATDHVGRDGAVRFYYEEGRTSELLLFKFFGQP